MKQALLILCLVCTTGFWENLAVAAPLRHDLIVMIDARHGKDSPVSFGAGVIVSQSKARTVIATALHVVANEAGDLASIIEVEFQRMRGRIYRATVLNAYIDVDLDLAVLFVEHPGPDGPPLVLSGDDVRQLSPTSPENLVGGTVQIIGAMDSERWAVGTKGDSVTTGSPWELRVKSGSAKAGASGGGVFDNDGRIVGISSRIDSVQGTLLAIPMITVIERLRRWGIEVLLTEADAASTEPAIQAQVIAGVKVGVAWVEPSLDASGNPVTTGAGYSHTLRAELSAAVKALSPRLEIKVTNASLDPMVLQPPDYIAQSNIAPVALTAEVWAVLPDGRRFGPVPVNLDFEKGPRAMAARANALTRERLEASIKYFWWNEAELSKARERGAAGAQDTLDAVAANREQAIRKQLPLVFSSWRIRCKKEDAWVCGRNGYIPTTPFGGRLGNAIHSIRIGPSDQDLFVDLPIDSSIDLGAELPRRVASLLEDGATSIFVRVQLATGEILGPKQICGVRQRSARVSPQCD